jgi:hypothetical protein
MKIDCPFECGSEIVSIPDHIPECTRKVKLTNTKKYWGKLYISCKYNPLHIIKILDKDSLSNHYFECEDKDYEDDDLIAKLKQNSDSESEQSFEDVTENNNVYLNQILFPKGTPEDEDSTKYYKMLYS